MLEYNTCVDNCTITIEYIIKLYLQVVKPSVDNVYVRTDDNNGQLLMWFEDNPNFYYGITCEVFGCYQEYGNYYRFASKTCSQFFRK